MIKKLINYRLFLHVQSVKYTSKILQSIYKMLFVNSFKCEVYLA